MSSLANIQAFLLKDVKPNNFNDKNYWRKHPKQNWNCNCEWNLLNCNLMIHIFSRIDIMPPMYFRHKFSKLEIKSVKTIFHDAASDSIDSFHRFVNIVIGDYNKTWWYFSKIVHDYVNVSTFIFAHQFDVIETIISSDE